MDMDAEAGVSRADDWFWQSPLGTTALRARRPPYGALWGQPEDGRVRVPLVAASVIPVGLRSGAQGDGDSTAGQVEDG